MIALFTFINFMIITWTSRTILAWAAEPHPLSAEHVYTPEWCRLVFGNVNWSAFTWNTMYFDQVVENERGLELKGSFIQPTRLCAILSFHHLSSPSLSSWSSPWCWSSSWSSTSLSPPGIARWALCHVISGVGEPRNTFFLRRVVLLEVEVKKTINKFYAVWLETV